jgi:hypothetical protein
MNTPADTAMTGAGTGAIADSAHLGTDTTAKTK